MFAIGTYVIYRAEGVCVISDIRKEIFSTLNKETEFYILNPINDRKSVVYVPCDNEALTNMMKPLLSADEITSLAATLKDERMELAPETRVRSSQYRDAFATGDRRALILLINTVNELVAKTEATGKKVGSTDSGALERAIRYLYDEFSYTSDISDHAELIDIIQGKKPCRPKKEQF